jgi:purine nucleoside phosphorylase
MLSIKAFIKTVILVIIVFWHPNVNAQLINITKHKNPYREYVESCQVRPVYCDLVISKLINRANQSIVVIQKDQFERSTLLALQQALLRHVNVGIIFNRESYNINYQDIRLLKSLGADIWLSNNTKLFRLVVVDQFISIVNSNSEYEENLTILHNATVSMVYINQWRSFAQNSQELKSIK